MVASRKVWLPALVFALAAALPAGAADPDKLLPGDTAVVAHVNVRQALDSKLFQKHGQAPLKDLLKQSAEAQKVLEAIGLDPFKDISGITVAAAATDAEKILIIVRGNFNLDKIHATADQVMKSDKSLTFTKQGNLRVYEAKGNTPMFAAFLDKGTVVASPSKDYVTGAVGGKAAKISKELQGMIAQADGKQTVWMAGVITDAMKQQLASNPQLADYAKKLTGFTGTVAVTTDVQMAVSIHTTDAKAAGEISELLNGIKGFASAAAANVPDFGPLLADVIDGLKIGANQAQVTVTGKISEDVIEKAIKQAQKK
jgi:hypothetical protein